MRTIGALIVCAATLLGCGATASGETGAPAPASPEDFAIVFKRGGGFTGSTEGLVVRPGRRAVATSTGTRAGERKVRFLIPVARVRALQEGLRRAHFGSIEIGPEESYCADCFTYAISYGGHRVSFVDPDLPPALEGVIGELEAVISARTIPPNA